jgi:hypothetical protein
MTSLERCARGCFEYPDNQWLIKVNLAHFIDSDKQRQYFQLQEKYLKCLVTEMILNEGRGMLPRK